MDQPALKQIQKGVYAGLKESGYTVGKNLKVDYQNAQGNQSNLKTMSEKFENEGVDLSIGITTPPQFPWLIQLRLPHFNEWSYRSTKCFLGTKFKAP